MVGIPDVLRLVYASVHTPDIIPQHLQMQLGSVCVFGSENQLSQNGCQLFLKESIIISPFVFFCVILKVVILLTRLHIPTADCLSSIFCSTLHHIANRWITFLPPELCTNISRLRERGGIKNVTARALEATSPFP